MSNNFEDLLEYLIVTDQVDEFLGLKEQQDEDEEDVDDEKEVYKRHR